jgi:hypothetical protein
MILGDYGGWLDKIFSVQEYQCVLLVCLVRVMQREHCGCLQRWRSPGYLLTTTLTVPFWLPAAMWHQAWMEAVSGHRRKLPGELLPLRKTWLPPVCNIPRLLYLLLSVSIVSLSPLAPGSYFMKTLMTFASLGLVVFTFCSLESWDQITEYPRR